MVLVALILFACALALGVPTALYARRSAGDALDWPWPWRVADADSLPGEGERVHLVGTVRRREDDATLDYEWAPDDAVAYRYYAYVVRARDDAPVESILTDVGGVVFDVEDDAGRVAVDPRNADLDVDFRKRRARSDTYTDAGGMEAAERSFLADRLRAYHEAGGTAPDHGFQGSDAETIPEALDGSLAIGSFDVNRGFLRVGDEVRLTGVVERGPDDDPVVAGGARPGHTHGSDLLVTTRTVPERLRSVAGDALIVGGGLFLTLLLVVFGTVSL